MTHRIGVIGGDGIGPEVVAEGLKVVRATGVDVETVDYDLGGSRYLRDGVILPDEVLDEWRDLDALYLGAVGTPEVPPGIIERGLLLKMRFALDLYVNLRPFLRSPATQAAPTGSAVTAAGPGGSAVTAAAPSGSAVASDLGIGGPSGGPGRAPTQAVPAGYVAADSAPPVDFLVVRENTEGTYAGEGGFLRKDTPHEIATQGSVNTRMGVERCVRYAFDLARGRERRHLTLVHKTNVLTFSGDLWQRTFDEVAAEYDDVATAYNHVDAACIYFVEDPGRYDVVVTDNLFGDILTDLGGAIAGGVGRAASANLNPDRTGPSMFEPVHGSAPDIAGTGTADPTAAILSAAMMLEFLGEADAAARIHKACAEPAPEGSTAAIGDAIAERVGHADRDG